MEKVLLLGNRIKEKRLALNLRMDDVARMAGITRTTLWNIEKGTTNCSIQIILKVLDALNLDIFIDDNDGPVLSRQRATRINTINDKIINRFVVMCMEQYASMEKMGSKMVYELFTKNKIIETLINEYEDLHGMSMEYIHNHINGLLEAR